MILYLLFVHKFWFLVTLTFLLLVMYEKFSRKKYFKWRVEAVVPGKLKSRLSLLPYSEEEYNMQFKSAFLAKAKSPKIQFKDQHLWLFTQLLWRLKKN